MTAERFSDEELGGLAGLTLGQAFRCAVLGDAGLKRLAGAVVEAFPELAGRMDGFLRWQRAPDGGMPGGRLGTLLLAARGADLIERHITGHWLDGETGPQGRLSGPNPRYTEDEKAHLSGKRRLDLERAKKDIRRTLAARAQAMREHETVCAFISRFDALLQCFIGAFAEGKLLAREEFGGTIVDTASWTREGRWIDIDANSFGDMNGLTRRSRYESLVVEVVASGAPLSALRADAPTVSTPNKPGSTGVPGTAKAESACRKWLMNMMSESLDRQPRIKEDYWCEAQQRFPGLTKRAFNRSWAVAIDETGAAWGTAGRPASRRKSNQHSKKS